MKDVPALRPAGYLCIQFIIKMNLFIYDNREHGHRVLKI
jgi:hypothetical protein